MPEAPVNEHRHLGRTEHQVGPAAKATDWLSVDAKTQTTGVENPT